MELFTFFPFQLACKVEMGQSRATTLPSSQEGAIPADGLTKTAKYWSLGENANNKGGSNMKTCHHKKHCVCACMWVFVNMQCVCVRVCERACMCVSVWMLSVTTQCNMSRLSFLDWDIMLYIFINMNIKLTFKHTLQAQAMCLNYCPVIAGYKSLYRHCLVLLFLCLYVLFCVCSGDYLAVLLFCHTLFWQGRGGLFFIAHAKC